MGEIPFELKRDRTLLSTESYDISTEPYLSHPTRPKYDSSDDKITHERKEQIYFDNWCQQIIRAYGNDILPFENNIDVWRQLWRTIEQSDVIILVVDIRNPLLHIPPSLINEIISKNKRLIVVLTKVDLV